MIRELGVLLAGFAATCVATEKPEEKAELPIELGITDSIVMTDKGEMYISSALDFLRLTDGQRFMIPTEIAYGLTDRFQLRTEIPVSIFDPDAGHSATGFGDINLAARYAVRDNRKQSFGLDAGLALTLPTGDRRRDLGEGRTGIEPIVTASQWFGPINVQMNLSWRHAVGDASDEPRDEFGYNVAAVWPIRPWYLVLEGNGETTRTVTNYHITPGVVWKPGEHIELRFAVPVGLTHASADYGIIAGVTIEFEDLFRHDTKLAR